MDNEELEDRFVCNHNARYGRFAKSSSSSSPAVRKNESKAKEIRWDDFRAYHVRDARRQKRTVVEWIVNEDGTQVQALADDGNYYPLHAVIKVRAESGSKPRWQGPGFISNGSVVVDKFPKDLPEPGTRMWKLLAEGKIGTPEQRKRLERFQRQIDAVRRKHDPSHSAA